MSGVNKRPFWPHLLTVAGAALMAACAGPVDRPAAAQKALQDPSVAPQRFGKTDAPINGRSTADAPDLAWDRFFTDTSLQGLIRLALEHNRDLRLAALNVEQVRAQALLRQADLWPSINAALGGVRLPTNTGSVSTTVTGGLTTAAYELDLFGRVRQTAGAAQAQLEASESLRRAARSSLIAAVATTYVNVQADAALLQLTRETVRTREEGLQMAQSRARVGASSALEVAQAEALLQSARAALAQVQRQKAVDESSLTLLVGTPIDTAGLPAAQAGPLMALMAPGLALRADLPSTVLSRRPDLEAAESQLTAAQANLEAARRAYFPRITLTASLGQASKELSSLFASGTWVWGVAPQLLMPIFDAGRTRAGVSQATAAQAAALAQYEKAIQVAFKEVSDALASRSTLDQQWAAVRAQVQAEEERTRLAETRWRLGASAYLDVLDAQRSLYAAQTALIQVQALRAQNQATLYKVLGGGSR